MNEKINSALVASHAAKYLRLNKDKKIIDMELKESKGIIGSEMARCGIEDYICGETAKVHMVHKTTKTLDAKKIESLLGYAIPEDCWKVTESTYADIRTL